jgi:hypothetical protein
VRKVQLICDIEDLEKEAVNSLPNDTSDLERTQSACDMFDLVLSFVFCSLPEDDPYSRWCLDDFLLETIQFPGDATVSLSCQAFWLEGGRFCPLVRIDIGVETDPLLYSFKFLKGYCDRQTLCIAKTGSGWLLSDG